jgi:phage terminase large subunit
MSEDDVDEARRSMSIAEFAQEYMADFNQYVGQIWTLNEGCIVKELPEFNSRLDIIAGLDLGFKDPTAMVIIGYDSEFDKYYVLDEYYDSEKTTAYHAARIAELIARWDIDYIYIDSAAQQTRFDLASDYDIATINAKKSVNDGIGYVASLVDSDKIIVPASCTQVLRSFDAYRWDPNENLIKEKPIHDSASHMADAIRYALYTHQTSIGIM